MTVAQALMLIGASLLLLWGVLVYARKRREFSRSLDLVFLRILVAKKDSDADEKRETTHDFKEQISLMEQLLSGLKALSSHSIASHVLGQEVFSFEYIAYEQEIYFYVVVPRKARALTEKQIVSFYPDAIVEETKEINIFKGAKVVKANELRIKSPFALPIRTYTKLESDPINPITTALGKISPTERCAIQILLRPIDDEWQEKVVDTKAGHHGFWHSLISAFDIFSSPEEEHKEPTAKESENEHQQTSKEKAKKTGYETIVRLIAVGDQEHAVEAQLKNMISAFSQFGAPGFNRLAPRKHYRTDMAKIVKGYIFRYFHKPFMWRKQILNTEEIASLFHFPHTRYNKAPEIRWQNFKIVKAPTNMPTDGILLGHNSFRGVKTPIYLTPEDRFRHFYVIGQTGTGKSSILQVMARQDVANGNGFALIDPHGDLAKDVLPFVPRSRADDVIFFDPSDMGRPMGLNLLEAADADEKQIVAADAMAIMIKLFGNEIFGPRLQDYFRNGTLTLMDYPSGGALTDIVRLFTDDNFQMERRRAIKDPIVRAWWDYTFSKMGEREKGEMIPFWAAKFGGFITNTLMRNIIGQTKSAFDIADVMNSGKLLFVNLSKGILGDQNSQLLGLILTSKIQMGAMKRQKIAKELRKDFFLYIDEFQNYVSDSIESILSEARKYRLGLIVAHQYLGQLQKSDALTKSNVNLKDAIFGNVGSMMSYKVGPEDAEFMAKQFAPNFSEQDLINMDKFKGVARISVGGQPTPAFSLIPVNPYTVKGNMNLAETYRQLSRLKYGREREFVEKEIIYRIGALSK